MTIRTLRNFINGRWVKPENDAYLDVENPSTGETIAQVPLSTAAAANEAISAAKEAFPAWAATPVSRRVEPLFKLAALIRDNEETLARMIAEEMGKSLPDAQVHKLGRHPALRPIHAPRQIALFLDAHLPPPARIVGFPQ